MKIELTKEELECLTMDTTHILTNIDLPVQDIELRNSLLKKLTPQPTREELTQKWIKDNNIVVGSKVKVVKKAELDGLIWDNEMDDYIGKLFQVKRIFDDYISIDNWLFPIESLEPYKEEYVPFAWEDRGLFRGKYVRSKGDFKKEFIVDNISEQYAFGSVTYQESFEYFEFVDGTTFGRLIN